MAADGIVVGLHVDAAASVGEVIPVPQHRTETRQQAIDDLFGLCWIVRCRFLLQCTQYRAASAHHIHRVRIGG